MLGGSIMAYGKRTWLKPFDVIFTVVLASILNPNIYRAS